MAEDREERLIAVLRAYVAAVNMSDDKHEDFTDSCADVVQEIWQGPTADARRLLAEIDGDACRICNAFAGEGHDHAADCPYHSACPHCHEDGAVEVIGETASGDYVRLCGMCGAEWEHYDHLTTFAQKGAETP